MRDKINQISAIALWFVSIYLWVKWEFCYIAVGLFVLHLIEVFFQGILVGKKAGKSTFYSIVMTLIFGFTWWLPIQKSLKNKI